MTTKPVTINKSKYMTEILFDFSEMPDVSLIGFSISSDKQAKASVDETEDDGFHWVGTPYIKLNEEGCFITPIIKKNEKIHYAMQLIRLEEEE